MNQSQHWDAPTVSLAVGATIAAWIQALMAAASPLVFDASLLNILSSPSEPQHSLRATAKRLCPGESKKRL
ncbi:hypothetical protein NQZ68_019999 [Dissostichus eleginoides]|nr:hypothetical protein NQZ68_019999 [Dissostichus eleginoides]